MRKDISNISILPNSTIIEALKKLNDTSKKVLLVAENNKLLGTLTDGDIRRYILRTGKIEGFIKDIFNPNPIYITRKELDKEKVKDIFSSNKVEIIPVVGEDLILLGYIEWSDILSEEEFSPVEQVDEDIPVVIMAGGKGTRMKPFTNVLPKPLIPIGNKTVTEYIIDKFRKFGFKKFILILNYKAEIIEAYFKTIEKDYDIDFIWEEEFLGTAGGLQRLIFYIYYRYPAL